MLGSKGTIQEALGKDTAPFLGPKAQDMAVSGIWRLSYPLVPKVCPETEVENIANAPLSPPSPTALYLLF